MCERYACFTVWLLLHRLVCWNLLCRHNINQQFWTLFHQTNEFARNISHTNITYLEASTDVKISFCLEKNGGDDAVDHKMDKKKKEKLGEMFHNVIGLKNSLIAHFQL